MNFNTPSFFEFWRDMYDYFYDMYRQSDEFLTTGDMYSNLFFMENLLDIIQNEIFKIK